MPYYTKGFYHQLFRQKTAVKVSIRHVRSVSDGVLIEHFTNETKVFTKEVSDIRNALIKINKQKREKKINERELYKAVKLDISIPFLMKPSKNFSMIIFDTPSSDEAVVDSLDIDTTIHDLASFVVVLDYRKMN